MTFWQGLAISIIFHANKSDNSHNKHDDEDATSSSSDGISSADTIQHILICMEMLFFSVAHWLVFPAEEWEGGYKLKFYDRPGFGFKDFASDVSLVIDSGKRSMQAKREKKKQGSGLEDSSSVSGRVSSFGSMDEATRSEEDNGTEPLV